MIELLNFFLSPFLNKIAAIAVIGLFFICCWGLITNTSVFLRKISGNGAGLLTTTGIFFTFVGITRGLYGFDIDNIDDSISELLEGMNTAFFSSVLGIGFAIVFKFLSSRQKTTTSGATADDIHRELQNIGKGLKSGLEALAEALGGEKDTSVISHLSKLRTTTTDKFDELTKEFKTFAEKMAEDNTRNLITALEEVMKDFNTKINEQFGDNFKQLNIAVGKLLEWQENYKTQVENLVTTYEITKESLEKSDKAMEGITEQTAKIPEHLKSMQDIVDALRGQSEDLQQKLGAFAELKDKATNAMPDIEKNLKDLTEGMRSNVEESVKGMKEVFDKQQDMATTIGNTYAVLPEKMQSSFEKFGKDMEQEIEKAINDCIRSLSREIAPLSKQFEEHVRSITQNAKEVVNFSQQTLTVMKARLQNERIQKTR